MLRDEHVRRQIRPIPELLKPRHIDDRHCFPDQLDELGGTGNIAVHETDEVDAWQAKRNRESGLASFGQGHETSLWAQRVGE